MDADDGEPVKSEVHLIIYLKTCYKSLNYYELNKVFEVHLMSSKFQGSMKKKSVTIRRNR